MPYIREITFSHVGRLEGCLCDRCGQYIQNIVTVHWTDGIVINYGKDCFSKLCETGKLTAHGIKLMRKALKSIEEHTAQLEKYKSGEINEENDSGWKYHQNSALYASPSYWYGKPYEEYRKWMIEEWFPRRFEEDQKEIARFSKVKFER